MITQCAWCWAVKSESQGWIPHNQNLAKAGHKNVSHGLCEPCAREKFGLKV